MIHDAETHQLKKQKKPKPRNNQRKEKEKKEKVLQKQGWRKIT